jgi:virulence factor Mce-like protein
MRTPTARAFRAPSRRPRAASHQPGRPLILGLGLGGVGFAILLVWIGLNAPNSIPLRSYYDVDVVFKDADNVAVHAQIRMGGKLVGQVLDPRVEDGKAVVTMQLTPDAGPLLSDTHVKVRPRSAIGVRYVEITPGTKGTPLKDGGTIPASQTGATRPLDEALSTFDPETRSHAQTLLREFGTSVAGRGEDLNAALGDAAPFASDLAGVTGTLADRDGAVAGFIRGADTAATAVDPVREDFTRGFTPEADVADIFAEEHAALYDTLAAAPPAFRAVTAGLHDTSPLLRQTTRFAKTALPLLRDAPASLRQTRALLHEAGPVLDDTEGTLDAAKSAVPPTLKLLRSLRPELTPLDTSFREATPIVNNLSPRICDMRLMLGNWGSMMEYGNTLGNFLRFNIPVSAESVQGWQSGVDLGRLVGNGNAYPAPCETGTEMAGGRK